MCWAELWHAHLIRSETKNSLAAILRSTFIKLQESITEVESPEQRAVEWLLSLWLWSQGGSDITVAVAGWWSVQQVTHTNTVWHVWQMQNLFCSVGMITTLTEWHLITVASSMIRQNYFWSCKTAWKLKVQRSKSLLDNHSILITLLSQFWGVKSCWSNLDEAQIQIHAALISCSDPSSTAWLQYPYSRISSIPRFFRRSFTLAGLNGWRAWKRKAETVAMPSARPSARPFQTVTMSTLATRMRDCLERRRRVMKINPRRNRTRNI